MPLMNPLSTGRIFLFRLASAVALIAALAVPATAEDPSWELAAKTFQTAMSRYRAKDYDQAAPLLSQFIKRHRTHEAVPVAHLYLADCQAELKQWDDREETLENLLRRYRGDAAWYLGWGRRLSRLHATGENDKYLAELIDFSRQTKKLPYQLIHRTGLEWNWHWYRSWPHTDRLPPHMRWLVSVFPAQGWERHIVDMADTPERAKVGLAALRNLLREYGEELPVDWQYAHVRLLENADQPEQARKQFDEYAQAWGKDPRGMGLWVLWAERYLNQAKDLKEQIRAQQRVAEGRMPESNKPDPNSTKETQSDAAERIEALRAAKTEADRLADEAYGALVKTYMGYFSLSALVGPRLDYLAAEDRFDDYAELAGLYMENYPQGNLRRTVAENWLRMLQPAVVNGDTEALTKAQSVLDGYYGKDSSHKHRWLTDAYAKMNQPGKAVETARYFIRSENWTRHGYNYLQSRIHWQKELQTLIDEAEKTYKLYGEAGGAAGELLADFKGRYKDQLERHMEELAQKLFTEHRQTGEAVEAAAMMVEYYLKRVVPEKRDTWMNRMLEGYPRHVRTEEMLARQVEALRGANRHREMLAMLDIYEKRFPGGFTGHWRHWRLNAYRQMNDDVRALAEARAMYEESAREGDYGSLERLYQLERQLGALEDSPAAAGGFWTEWAERLEGTRAGLFCLRQALDPLYHRPFHQKHLEQEPLTDKALDICRKLREQTLDPEIAWNSEFSDIEILSDQGRAGEAIDAIETRTAGASRLRDLSRRVMLGYLGFRAAQEKKDSLAALRMGKQLARKLYTHDDQRALTDLAASVYYHNGEHARAEREYWSIIQATPYPAEEFGTMRRILDCARRDSHASAYRAMTRCIQALDNAQSVIPRLLADQGKAALNARDATFQRILGTLKSKYPDSHALGELHAEYVKKAQRAREGK